MQYIHIRNLQKFHPGYKDRTLQWAKIYFKTVQGDPDCEMIENETDWGRLIKFILLELEAQKPIPINEKYLTKKGFNLKKRPIQLTINVLHNFVEVIHGDVGMPTDPRHTEEDKDKDKDKDKDSKQASPALTAALDKIYKDGFNIYALINKAKQHIGQTKDWQFPEEVLLRVCEAFAKDRDWIKQPWPWFIKVLKAESGLWHADQQIKSNDKQAGFAPSVKEILGIK